MPFESLSAEQVSLLIAGSIGLLIWKFANMWQPNPAKFRSEGNMSVYTQVELKSEDRQLIRDFCNETGKLRQAVHDLREPLNNIAKELEYSGRARGERREGR